MDRQNAALSFTPTIAPFVASENRLPTPDSDAEAVSQTTLRSDLSSNDSTQSRKHHLNHDTALPNGPNGQLPKGDYIGAIENPPTTLPDPLPLPADLLPTSLQFLGPPRPPPPPPPPPPPFADFLDMSETFDDIAEVPEIPGVQGVLVPYKTLHKFSRAMGMRNEAVKQRNRMELRRRNYTSELTHNTNARDDLLMLGDGIMEALEKIENVSTLDELAQIQAAWAMFKELNVKISNRSRAIQKLGKMISKSDMELIALDNKLHAKEEGFLKEALRYIDDQSKMTDDHGSDAPTERKSIPGTISVGSSDGMNPLEHEYYDAIGDVTLAREHLYNLETDHRTNMYHRQAKRDIGALPTVPEDEFWQEYFEERQALVEAYVSGKAKVERLYRQCLEYEFAVDPPNLPPLGEQVLDHSNRAEKIILNGAGDWIPQLSNRRLGDQGSKMLMATNVKWATQLTRAKVLNWKQGVSNEHEDEYLTDPEEYPPSQVISDGDGDGDGDEEEWDSGEVYDSEDKAFGGSIRKSRGVWADSYSRRSSLAGSPPPQNFPPDKPRRRYSDPAHQARRVSVQQGLVRTMRPRVLSTSIVR